MSDQAAAVRLFQETVDNLKSMSAQQQEEAIKEADLTINGTSPKTRDALWKIVIAAFSTVLIGAFGVLSASVFIKDMNPDVILTTFTTVVGFLAVYLRLAL